MIRRLAACGATALLGLIFLLFAIGFVINSFDETLRLENRQRVCRAIVRNFVRLESDRTHVFRGMGVDATLVATSRPHV